jgi:hypothetical protein
LFYEEPEIGQRGISHKRVRCEIGIRGGGQELKRANFGQHHPAAINANRGSGAEFARTRLD